MIQCANLMLGLDETAGPAGRGSLSMSVTAAEGFVAAGCHAGIKRRRYDMALVATDDRRPVDGRRRLHPEQVRRAAGRAVARAGSPRMAARRRRSSSIRAMPMPAPAPPASPTPRRWRAAAAEALGVADGGRAGLLDRDHRHAAADGHDPRGDAEAGEEAVGRRRRTTRPRASSPPITGPRRRWSRARPSRSAAWPRAAA